MIRSQKYTYTFHMEVLNSLHFRLPFMLFFFTFLLQLFIFDKHLFFPLFHNEIHGIKYWNSILSVDCQYGIDIYFFLEENMSYEDALSPAKSKYCGQDLMKTLHIFSITRALENTTLFQKYNFLA